MSQPQNAPRVNRHFQESRYWNGGTRAAVSRFPPLRGRVDTNEFDAMARRAQRCDYCAVIPVFHPVIPDFHPVIPAKSGIQRVAIKPGTRNQVQISASGSLLPSWEKARMRVSPRASAALRAGRPRSQRVQLPVIPAKAGIQIVATNFATEIRYKSPPADPLFLYGLAGAGLRPNSPRRNRAYARHPHPSPLP